MDVKMDLSQGRMFPSETATPPLREGRFRSGRFGPVDAHTNDRFGSGRVVSSKWKGMAK